MFEEILSKPSLRERLKRTFLYFPSVAVSVLLHVLAILVLLVHPEIAFPAKIFLSKGRTYHASEPKTLRVITYVDQPMTYVPPTRKPEGNLYSDRDRAARSRPPKVMKTARKLPYSRGTSRSPERIDVVARKQAPPAESKPVEPAKAEEPNQAQAAEKLAQEAKPKEIKRDGFVPPPPEKEKSTGSEQVAQKGAPSTNVFENKESALKSPGSGLFDTKGFELGNYWREVVRRIKENWIVPEPIRYSRGRLILIFYIEKDGRISGLRLVNTSGNSSLDMSALHSVLASNPFPPLPKEFVGENVGAKFVFSYHEDN